MPFALLLVLVQTATATPPVVPPAAPQDKIVCRAQEVATGSIMPSKRVCRRKSEWAALDAGNARNVERFNENRRLGQRPGGE